MFTNPGPYWWCRVGAECWGTSPWPTRLSSTLEVGASTLASGMPPAAAGALLADKAALLARSLGLDTSLPLGELIARANAATGSKMGEHVNSNQMREAEALVATAHKRPAPAASPPSLVSAVACVACGRPTTRACSANGCCGHCIAEVHRAEVVGHQCVDKAEEAQVDAVGGAGAHGYGEVTVVGVRQLAARLALSAADVFVDAGSGTGRVVLQVAREFGVRRAVGIELSPSRHFLALEAMAASTVADRVQFVCADCAGLRLWTRGGVGGVGGDGATATAGAPLADATVVFACSLLYPDALMARLARCIEVCSSIRIVASLRRFGRAHGGLRGFVEVGPPLTCETSWMVPRTVDNPLDLHSPGSAVYLYERSRDATSTANATPTDTVAAPAPPCTAADANAMDADSSLIASLNVSLESAEARAAAVDARLTAALERLRQPRLGTYPSQSSLPACAQAAGLALVRTVGGGSEWIFTDAR